MNIDRKGLSEKHRAVLSSWFDRTLWLVDKQNLSLETLEPLLDPQQF